MLQAHFPLQISAILVDLDGTLLHTAPELAEAANRMLRDMGRPAVSQDLLMSYIGNGIGWLVKRALTGSLRHGEAEPSGAGGGCGRYSGTNRSHAPYHAADMHAEPDAALFEKALPVFDRHYAALLLRSQPFDRVIEGLEAMRQAGFRLGCITNKAARFTGPLLEGSGLAKYFEIAVSGDSLPEKKPHPLPLLHAAGFFGVPPEQVLMIGDSLNDTLAARAAGCPVVCVPYGYNHGEAVDKLDLDAVIPDLPSALDLIMRAQA
ncbi:MAG: phosphoglycolate phosphatase [Nitrosomonadales bacterium]|nr:phosphoglycolate phosphatase [Nitrosomonadales bacterium]